MWSSFVALSDFLHILVKCRLIELLLLEYIQVQRPTIYGGLKMSYSRILKWISGIFELVLAVPIVGGAIVMGSGYSALGFMLVLHAVTLILSLRNQEAIYGSVWGVLTSLLAWIPFVGWALHLIAAILLMISGSKKTKRYHYPPNQL